MNLLLYIDPGTGSYLIQILVGAVLGILYFFKNIKLYIKSFFVKDKNKAKTEPTEENKEE